MQGQTLSHYRILDKLGEGGMGEVYLADDLRLDRKIALKVLPETVASDADLQERLQREAKVIAALNHPNIVTLYSVEEADGAQFLTMEYVEGDTLDQLIPAGGMPIPRVFAIAMRLVDALGAAHRKGIIHRDLKPANIKITPGGEVKILDFGLARTVAVPDFPSLPEDDTTELLAEAPELSGTLRYMAPEQLRAESVDERADVYALGATLYELVVGQPPFSDSDGFRLIADIQHTKPSPPRLLNSDVPVELEAIVLKCLEKTRERRYESARAVSEALRKARSASLATPRTLAVLYFESSSGTKEDEYLRDGMTEDVIIELSKMRDLSVLSRSSVMPFRDLGVPATEAGQKLEVAYVLDGSLRRAGDNLRVTTTLVETKSGRSVWAERFDRQLEDVFAIQAEIAESIAGALRVMLTDAERRAIAKPPTTNVDAYEQYLRGRQSFRQFRRRSIEFAQKKFERAIAMDPDYAAAYAGLADSYSYLYMFWAATKENLKGADEASRMAVRLDFDLAEAHVARGIAVSLSKRYDEAGQEFEAAVRLNPKLFEAYYFYARTHYNCGKLEEAVRWFRRACDARREDYQAPTLMASALRGLGRKQESDDTYRRALELAQAHLQLYPGDARALYFSAISLAQLGERPAESLKFAERALAIDPEEPQILYNVACVYALLGRPGEAIDCLGGTIIHGEWWQTWMEHDPDLSSLHDDPRFRALLR
ncbi:MAG: protein kinase [bacterium]|nr:protein kinase [bacterium]